MSDKPVIGTLVNKKLGFHFGTTASPVVIDGHIVAEAGKITPIGRKTGWRWDGAPPKEQGE